MAALSALALSGTVMAAGTTVFDSIPSPVPGNVPSLGNEAYAQSELGSRIGFAAGPRQLREISVLMSSWGCEAGHWYTADCATTPGSTFSHPLTVNVYGVGSGGAVGSLLATKTQSFSIPFRPSADPDCGGGAWQASNGDCFNGLGHVVTWNMASLGLTLPNEVIVSVTYNTSHYGYAPIGTSAACYTSSAGCGYDSLNIGLVDPSTDVSVGTFPAPDDMYWNTTVAGWYCDGGTGGSGTFRLDAGCWTGYQMGVEVTASYPTAASANACKKDGWMTLSRADGSNFKNQGDCIQYVNTAK